MKMKRHMSAEERERIAEANAEAVGSAPGGGGRSGEVGRGERLHNAGP